MKINSVLMYVFIAAAVGGNTLADPVTILFAADDDYPASRGLPRSYTGHIVFDETPRPLMPVEVEFSIDRTESMEVMFSATPLFLAYDSSTVKVIGDTHWPPGVLAGRFTIIPLRSGYQGFSLGFGSYPGRFDVRWCMTPTGELTFLGKNDLISGCDESWCVFFDSVLVVQSRLEPVPQPGDLFDYTCRFSQLPRLNDTFTLQIDLTFLRDCLDGANMQVFSDGFELLSLPHRLSDPIHAGEIVTLELVIMPKPIRSIHDLSVSVLTHISSTLFDNNVRLGAVFDENGDLLCITDRPPTKDMNVIADREHATLTSTGPKRIYDISSEGISKDRANILEERVESGKGD